MAYKIEDLLLELEGQEKTAETAFTASILGGNEKVAAETPAPVAPAAPAAPAEKVASLSQEELVKQAQEMGQIAAHSFFSELAALGIALPTTRVMQVPPISQISQPQQSPVTVAADAALQMQAGMDSYDALGRGRSMQKRASSNIVANLYNKIYNK